MSLPGLSYIFALEVSSYKVKRPATDSEPDVICLFCRETYIQHGNSEGCLAVRIKSCGHVIGFKCLKKWLRTHPAECPYYNHPIPRTIEYLMHTDPKTWYNKVLKWILFSRLGRHWDRKLPDSVRDMPGTAGPFLALIHGRMTDGHLKNLEHAFFLALEDSVVINSTFTFLLVLWWVGFSNVCILLFSQELVVASKKYRKSHGKLHAFLTSNHEPKSYLVALQAWMWLYCPAVGLALFQIAWLLYLGLIWLVVRSLLRFARSVYGLARREQKTD